MIATEPELVAFVGLTARLWDFSPTHDHLVIKIALADATERFLVLSGCDEISLPVFWRITAPRMVGVERPLLEFVDEGVRVCCQDVSIHSVYSRS